MSVTVRMTCVILSVVELTGCAVGTAIDDVAIGNETNDASVPSSLDSDGRQTPASLTVADAAPTGLGFASSARSEDSSLAGAASDHDDAGVSATSDAGSSASAPNAATDALGAQAARPASSDAGVVSAPASTSSNEAAPSTAVTVTPTAIPTIAPAVAATCAVPSEAALADVSKPSTVVGTGTPASCTSSAFVAAVEQGGIITFNCGSAPTTITLDRTARVFNDKSQRVVIDGGNKVTLSGGGKVRILYQNTCDQNLHWTTEHCDNQEFPQLTVQNLTFEDGNAKGSGEGGGALYASGGRVKVINSRFYNNVCDDTGPDVGGGALRVLQQFNGLPAYVVGSTFGGDRAHGNVGSNGGAVSALGASLEVLNSAFTYNRAIGQGASPAAAGTPGGGSGGAIYVNGNNISLELCGTRIENNDANEGGGAVFFVSNDRSGSVTIDRSTLQTNKSGKFENFPGMFVLAKQDPTELDSTVE
jgi:hypothetical protein